jgi:hypothetical protein
VITKRFKTFFFEELGPFPGENILFPMECVILFKELGPFPKQKLLLPKEIIF